MGHAFTHSLHDARALHAQAMGHGQGVQTSAVVNVNEIQAHGFVANADFTRAGVTHGHVDEVQFFGTAGFVEMNGFVHVVLL
jgi:hypothetical protein